MVGVKFVVFIQEPEKVPLCALESAIAGDTPT